MGEEFGTTKTLDDGSVLFLDGDGGVVYAQNQAGASIPVAGAQGGALQQQFWSLLNYGIRSVIDAKINQPAQAAAYQARSQTAAGASVAQLMPLLLLAGGALLLFKLAR